MQKKWQLIEVPDREEFSTIPSLLFASRNLVDPNEIAAFVSPDWDSGIHDPFLFRQMPAAVERIYQALDAGEHVTVHGDYDADGVTGSAVMISVLKFLIEMRGPQEKMPVIDFYIPHRDEEGYGLHPKTIEMLHERGTTLIITVDCGISCVAEIAQANELGIETIVVDHHQFGETLPDGYLIHPKLPGEAYPFPHLAAVGVAFKFACALLSEGRGRGLPIVVGWEKWLLDFVSIATVTDMVPMVGENRVLETFGLKVLNKTRRPGLRKLIELSGCELGKLTTESVGFALGPRINAAGRMDRATVALQLMLAESVEEASILGAQIEKLNRQRQETTKSMMQDAELKLAEASPFNVLVLSSETWSPSLVGIVAGRLLEAHGKPSVIIGKFGDRWVGSGRSFASYDITEAMKRSSGELLSHVGGHVQACGFSFSGDASLDLVTAQLRADAAERLSADSCVPVLMIDAEVSFDDLSWELVETLNQFEPFGMENRRPVFLTRKVEVLACDLIGSTQNHVRCTLRHLSGRSMKCIGFSFGPRISEFALGTYIDVVYDVSVNEWNGHREIQCKLVDVRPAEL
ncbi:single-stranded-DNA-specific exonuclease RecJ [Patescibacteria group bacterium]|nr:single-stranded-DNA-specific exonuclease RecJ [Patescibacteria group bacterium]